MTRVLKISPDLTLPLDAVKAAEDRLWSKVDRRGADECWPWLASTDSSGYGHLRICGKLFHANRAIFFLLHGWLPEVVMHSCDTPPCSNPAHLLPGTKALNNADKMAKGRHRSTYGDDNGARRHPERLSRGDAHYARRAPERLARGEQHGQAVLTSDNVAIIRALFEAGAATKAELARRFGVGQSQIGRIIRREVWT